MGNKKDGKHLKFIGIGHVTEPGAAGHLQALKMGANDTVGFDEVLKVVNHLSTDGEAKNTGQHYGLWKLLDDEREKLDDSFPLLKSICAVHSTANAYKDLCKSVPEIDHLVKKLSGIATFFHASAKCTTDLEKVGAKEGLTVCRIPKYFEVRWSEFTAALLDAILCSWQALVKFFEEQYDTEGNKFLKLLTNKDNILMMCFVADLLFLLKVFQKKLQRDSLTIVDIEPEAEKFQKSLDKLGTRSLLGGWDFIQRKLAFKESIQRKLWEKKRRRPEANLSVTDRREFSAVRNESILALKEFMDTRLKVDKNTSKSFTPFIKFTANEDEIRDVHQSIAPDLSLANLAIQYQELQQCNEIPKGNPHTVLQSIVEADEEVGEQHYANVSSLKRQTMSDYLYIHINMPPLSTFDPQPATLQWMDEKEHRTRNTPKAGEQEWFSHVFLQDNSFENEEAKEVKRKF
ncbi:E3 SUMO- ligase KIAA1586-like isoform X3 [Paramuricea clavata]|uniref:E3 SUMO- ligase KIAA1586-like isoform X3 n=1 Tax=Paramuricea clavata TaxID=317549 RepID=A0A6S7JHF7_PARCT|nr:E3 SUMO- ligase KIAA1586-like isoform X3 [Paramuricea clavata]